MIFNTSPIKPRTPSPFSSPLLLILSRQAAQFSRWSCRICSYSWAIPAWVSIPALPPLVSSSSLTLARRMICLPRLFSQIFEHTDDHQSRHRLQSPLAVTPGSTSHRQTWIRDYCHLLNTVRCFITIAARRNLAAVELQYRLAGKAPRR
jgi:hypothetical protein